MILFVPSVQQGNGTGHLCRCFDLAKELNGAVYLSANPSYGCRSADELRLAFPIETSSVKIITEVYESDTYTCIVLDKRESTTEEYFFWSKFGSVLALDEGGEARKLMPYLIDVLPVQKKIIKEGGAANIASSAFLKLPLARKTHDSVIRSVLISFGGEDSHALAEKFLSVFTKYSNVKPDQISLVAGPLSGFASQFPGIQLLGQVQNLKEILCNYDLVVTHFGFTAYEAAWAGAAVLLLNPSKVHEALSNQAGFVSLGVQKPSIKRFIKAMNNIEALHTVLPEESKNLAEYINSLSFPKNTACPACAGLDGKVLYRSPEKTSLYCRSCGLIQTLHFGSSCVSYSDPAYFNEEYKTLYGKTYIEDMPNLRNHARRRLAIIESLINGIKRQVLDIGCAYGAFVLEAQNRNWDSYGSDISEHAVNYVTSECKVPAFTGDFSHPGNDGLYPRNNTCISMWFVIEHFYCLDSVLQRTATLLQPGGIFAFSTPNSLGISGRKNRKLFLEQSPLDHRTIWNPGSTKKVLSAYGFTVKRIVITGHHPERFPFGTKNKRTFRYAFFMALSKIFKLGDTFECYAELKADKK
jgi:2-polyprenyl-3-methyl-5-hydroxy-6-metoxy-1,4-benzoquinol methylase